MGSPSANGFWFFTRGLYFPRRLPPATTFSRSWSEMRTSLATLLLWSLGITSVGAKQCSYGDDPQIIAHTGSPVGLEKLYNGGQWIPRPVRLGSLTSSIQSHCTSPSQAARSLRSASCISQTLLASNWSRTNCKFSRQIAYCVLRPNIDSQPCRLVFPSRLLDRRPRHVQRRPGSDGPRHARIQRDSVDSGPRTQRNRSHPRYRRSVPAVDRCR